MDKMSAQMKDYATSARKLTAQEVRLGDIVRMKQSVFIKYSGETTGLLLYKENIFKIAGIKSEGGLMLAESGLQLRLEDIEAVLIDGKEDAGVYYDPVVAAGYYEQVKSIPVRHTDYSYYLEQFKSSPYEGISLYDHVQKHGFQFVHEVQHWMQDELQDYGLKLNYTLR